MIRLSSQVRLAGWREAISTLILGLESADVVGKLWVIQGDRIREYRPIVARSVDDE